MAEQNFVTPSVFPIMASFDFAEEPVIAKDEIELTLTIWARSFENFLILKSVTAHFEGQQAVCFMKFERTPITKGHLVAFRLVEVFSQLPEGLSPSPYRQIFGSLGHQLIGEEFLRGSFHHG